MCSQMFCDAVDWEAEKRLIDANVRHALRSPAPSEHDSEDGVPEKEGPGQIAAGSASKSLEIDGLGVCPYTDGDSTVHPEPTTTNRVVTLDGPEAPTLIHWLQKLGIRRLPMNYVLYNQDRSDGQSTDRYLWGHPSGRKFRSCNEFLPHLTWLSEGKHDIPCLCKNCYDIVTVPVPDIDSNIADKDEATNDVTQIPIETTNNADIEGTTEEGLPMEEGTKGGSIYQNESGTSLNEQEEERPLKRPREDEEEEEEEDGSYHGSNFESEEDEDFDSDEDEDEDESDSEDMDFGPSEDQYNGFPSKKPRLSSPTEEDIHKTITEERLFAISPCRVGEVAWCPKVLLSPTNVMKEVPASHWPVLVLNDINPSKANTHDVLVLPLPLPTASEVARATELLPPIKLDPPADLFLTPSHYSCKTVPLFVGPRKVSSEDLIPFSVKPFTGLHILKSSGTPANRVYNRGLIQSIGALSSWEAIVLGEVITPADMEENSGVTEEESPYIFTEVLELRWGTEVIRKGDLIHVAIPPPPKFMIRLMHAEMNAVNFFQHLVTRYPTASIGGEPLSHFQDDSNFYSSSKNAHIMEVGRFIRKELKPGSSKKDAKPKILVEGDVFEVTPDLTGAGASVKFMGRGTYEASRVIHGRRFGCQNYQIGLQSRPPLEPEIDQQKISDFGEETSLKSLPQVRTFNITPGLSGPGGNFGMIGAVCNEEKRFWEEFLPERPPSLQNSSAHSQCLIGLPPFVSIIKGLEVVAGTEAQD